MMGRLSAAGGEANAGRFLETTATEPDPTRSLTLYVARRAFALSSFIRLGLDVASCPESVQKVSRKCLSPGKHKKPKTAIPCAMARVKTVFIKGGFHPKPNVRGCPPKGISVLLVFNQWSIATRCGEWLLIEVLKTHCAPIHQQRFPKKGYSITVSLSSPTKKMHAASAALVVVCTEFFTCRIGDHEKRVYLRPRLGSVHPRQDRW